MERQNFLNTANAVRFLYLIYFVGIIGHISEAVRPLMLTITPYVLLISGAIIFYFLIRDAKQRIIIFATILYSMTFIVEVIGVKTGLIFGNYFYGDTLGFKFFDVPLIIGFNWVLIILGSIFIAEQVNNKPLLTALLAGTLALLFDVILEPVAVKLNYWGWENNIIPLKNYLAWFLITFFSSLMYDAFKLNLKNRIIEQYYIIQLLFFLILSFSI